MESGIDAKNLVHLPLWAKLICLCALSLGIVTSIGFTVRFFGANDSRDWVLIGITSMQFLITTLVVAVVLFASQTDANIATLSKRAETFLSSTLPEALDRVTLDDEGATRIVAERGRLRDIFGYDYELRRRVESGRGELLMRLWCGVNVGRLIVIYRFSDPSRAVPLDGSPDAARTLRSPGDFIKELETIFRFSFSGAEAAGYKKPHFEPLPSDNGIVSAWLTADTTPEFLTDPAAKLFWSQDIAMMIESVLRTALRHPTEVALDLSTRPRPQ